MTPDDGASRPRYRRPALATAVLAVGVTGVLLASQGAAGGPVTPPGTADRTVAAAAAPSVPVPAGAVHRVGAVHPAGAARRTASAAPTGSLSTGSLSTGSLSAVLSASPSTVQERTVAAGLVDIDTVMDGGSARGAGTGIVLTADGTVLTNDHVVANASTVEVTDLGNGRTYRGVVVGADRAHDVAVVRAVGATGLQVAPLASGSGPRVGAPVVGIGDAGGVGTPSAAPGVVTALGQRITASDEGSAATERLTGMIATTAPLRPGDSGGALVDGSGRVVGMDTAAAPDASVGFAIPIARALAFAERIV